MNGESNHHSLDQRDESPFDLEPMNEKMLFRPDYRSINKLNWMSKHLKFNQSSKDWNVIKNESKEQSEPFLGGKEFLKKNGERDRVKRRDISPI